MKRERSRAEDFTIGWICALHIELGAATVVLDEEYDSIDGAEQYVVGRVGVHDVVIACLPAGQYGTNSAAVTAAELHSKFCSLRYWLMVGIGGGVPTSDTDIRLGDVVVCQPQGQHGGVIQYDLGRTKPDGQHRIGSLNAPPPALGAAVSRMHAVYEVGRSKSQAFLTSFKHLPRFQHPIEEDVLFEPGYQHVGGPTCQCCLRDRVISRPSRPNQDLNVHFGLIASGNQVIRDGVKRDKLSAELGGVLCFEMEAAGLMNHFPCLVVRGICDYADSHKNKFWQPYASATAAACAKEILSFVPSANLASQETRKISYGLRITQQPEDHLHGPTETFDDNSVHGPQSTQGKGKGMIQPDVPLSEDPQVRIRKYLNSLSFESINARHATINSAHSKTCWWILEGSEYQAWLNDKHLEKHHGFLWIKGKPGSGKSTLMKFILAKASSSVAGGVTASFFFNARGDDLEKSTLGMYKSILHQILKGIPVLQNVLLLRPPRSEGKGSFVWSVEILKVALRNAVERLNDIPLLILIDALDECDEDEIRDMVSFFETLGKIAISKRLKLRTCFSSRHYPQVVINRRVQLILEDEKEHENDIAKFLDDELRGGQSKFMNEMRLDIIQRASGIFLWVVLVVAILNTELARGNKHTMRKRLRDIPDGLNDLFKDILARDDRNFDQLVSCIQWVLHARVPLTIHELYSAILIGIDPDPISTWRPSEITPEDMQSFVLNTSKGLVQETRDNPKTIQFIHESVRDFLLLGHGLDDATFGSHKTFEARSHEMLKQGCLEYMMHPVVQAFLHRVVSGPWASDMLWATKHQRSLLANAQPLLDLIWKLSFDMTINQCASSGATHASVEQFKYMLGEGPAIETFRRAISLGFPLLSYAIENIMHHSDTAAHLGVSQKSFVDNFPLNTWKIMQNTIASGMERSLSPDLSLIYILAENDLPNLLEIELERVTDVNVRGGRYNFPIIAAQTLRRERTLRVLLSHHLRDRDDISEAEFEQAVSTLLTKIIPFYITDETILQWAIRVSDLVVWRIFLPRGEMNSEAINALGKEMLCQASNHGFTATVKALLQHGVGVNCRGHAGRLPLWMACKSGRVETVELLLSYGTEAHLMNLDFPLEDLETFGTRCYETMKLLLVSESDESWKTEFCLRHLTRAIYSGNVDMRRLLLSHVNSSSLTETGTTARRALSASMQGFGSAEAIEMLLKHGVDINILMDDLI